MNFFRSMMSENGDISSKRWISVTTALAVFFTIIWTVVKYKDLTLDALHSSMIFIAVMSGVATVAQIVALVKGGPISPDNSTTTTTTNTNISANQTETIETKQP